jgi:aryl-alcohol dehydrogenase
MIEIHAAVLRSAKAPFTIEPVQLPALAPDQVLVRIVGVGMCHTDLLVRRIESFAPLPFIGGHEGAGVVEAVGARVSGIEVGAHVVLSFDFCGDCRNCLEGHPAYCDTFNLRNMGGGAPDPSPAIGVDGAPIGARWFGQSSFATHALSTGRNTVVVDRSVPLELVGPLGCGVLTGAGAVFSATRVPFGSTVAVFGVGAVGLSVVMAARVAGAVNIVAIDLHENRLKLAQDLGATHLFSGDPGVAAAITKATGGADFSFDTTGVPQVVAEAVTALRAGGVCGLIGAATGPSILEPSMIKRGRSVIGIVEGDAVPKRLIPQILELWRQDRFPFDRLIQTYGLSEINEAERASLSGQVIKPVLLPDG